MTLYITRPMGSVTSCVTVADLLLLDALARQALRRERVFRKRIDNLAETDEWLTSRFRSPRTVLLQICSLLEPQEHANQIQFHHTFRSSPPLDFWPREPFKGRLETDRGCPSPRALSLVIKALISLSPMVHQIPPHRCQTSTN